MTKPTRPPITSWEELRQRSKEYHEWSTSQNLSHVNLGDLPLAIQEESLERCAELREATIRLLPTASPDTQKQVMASLAQMDIAVQQMPLSRRH